MANGMMGAVLGISAAAVSRRGWVYFGTYHGRWMGSDGTFVSMFSLPSDDPGVYRNRGDAGKDRQYRARSCRLPSSTPTYAVLVSWYHVKVAISRVQGPTSQAQMCSILSGLSCHRCSPVPGNSRLQQPCSSRSGSAAMRRKLIDRTDAQDSALARAITQIKSTHAPWRITAWGHVTTYTGVQVASLEIAAGAVGEPVSL